MEHLKSLLTKATEQKPSPTALLPEGATEQSQHPCYAGLFDYRPTKKPRCGVEQSCPPTRADAESDVTALADEFVRVSNLEGNSSEAFNHILNLLTDALQQTTQRAVTPIYALLSLLIPIFSTHPTYPGNIFADLITAVIPLLKISSSENWILGFTFVLPFLRAKDISQKIDRRVGIGIVKHVLTEINALDNHLNAQQLQCVNIGCNVIDALVVGSASGDAGCVSYYDIIGQLPYIYGDINSGMVLKNVHWTMEPFIFELCKRRRRLLRLVIAPDAFWPLVSQHSRRHEYTHLRFRQSYRLFVDDMDILSKSNQITSCESHLRDMLFQRSPIDEFRALVKTIQQNPALVTRRGVLINPAKRAMMEKVKDVITAIQLRSNFVDPRPETYECASPPSGLLKPEDVKVAMPEHWDHWEVMNELADQLYSFVSASTGPRAAGLLSFDDTIEEFEKLAGISSTDVGGQYHLNDDDGSRILLSRDNALPWLLLQLLHNEALHPVIANNFHTEERLLSSMIRMFNPKQAWSVDGFYLRDLSLQCAINHQHSNLKERSNLRHRHPQFTPAMPFLQICYHVQGCFTQQYKNKVNNSTVLHNLPMTEVIKIAIVSQMRQDLVPNTFYVFLVPSKSDTDIAISPRCYYLKGGSLNYRLLDFIAINGKIRLLALIHKIMLTCETGPRVHLHPGANVQVNCISPYVIDTVYKLLYSAPCSEEIMVKEIFEKTRNCDAAVKSHAVAGTPFPDHLHRWQHTILQLLNFRLLRFLKFSSLAPRLLDCVRLSLSHLHHRERFREVESFALMSQMIQGDMKILRFLVDHIPERSFWFAESEMLARGMVFSIARLIRLLGPSDAPMDLLSAALQKLHPIPLRWSETTLLNFPEPLRSYYAQFRSYNSPDSSVTEEQVDAVVTQSNMHNIFLVYRPNEESEQQLKEKYSTLENQPLFLCVIWTLVVMQNGVNAFIMEYLRKIMLHFPPARMASYTFKLVDYVLDKEYHDMSWNRIFGLFNEFIWKYQLVAFEHVLFSLARGLHDGAKSEVAFEMLRYLFMESNEFHDRLTTWKRIGFRKRYWTEDNHSELLKQYLNVYPEYHQFESYAAAMHNKAPADNENERNPTEAATSSLDPPLQTSVPVYYTNVLMRTLPVMDIVIGRLIEYNKSELLMDILNRYSELYHYHQFPLSFVRDLLHYHYGASALQNPRVVKSIVRLLEFSQHDLVPDLVGYVCDDTADRSAFGSGYFERVVRKLCEAVAVEKCGFKSRPELPERHFREIPNPVSQALYVSSIEILACPLSSTEIVSGLLAMALEQTGCSVLGKSSARIHALGLLMANLPMEHFIPPFFEALVTLIKSDLFLTETSESREKTRAHRFLQIPAFPYTTPSPEESIDDFSSNHHREEVRIQPPSMHPYILNSYAFNVAQHTTNEPNSFLTLLHSVLHYSGADRLELLQPYIGYLVTNLTTDTQLLYVCAVVGPILYRLEKTPALLHLYVADILHMVQALGPKLEIQGTYTSTAAEQIVDFLNHLRHETALGAETTAMARDVVWSLPLALRSRLRCYLDA